MRYKCVKNVLLNYFNYHSMAFIFLLKLFRGQFCSITKHIGSCFGRRTLQQQNIGISYQRRKVDLQSRFQSSFKNLKMCFQNFDYNAFNQNLACEIISV